MSRGIFLYKGKPYDFGRLQVNLANVKRTLPPVLAQVAVNHFKDSFRDQGFTDRSLKKWPERKSGLKRDTGRAILVKSADLRNSIHPSVETFTRIEIVSDKPYAQAHNEGFKGAVRVRSHVRNTRSGTASTVRAHKREMNLPQRQFMGHSTVMEAEIETAIDRMVLSCFN